MSHAAHIANHNFLFFPMYVAQTKKKAEPKTARVGEWIESNAVKEVNHDSESPDRESDRRDSESDATDVRRGFDLTV